MSRQGEAQGYGLLKKGCVDAAPPPCHATHAVYPPL